MLQVERNKIIEDGWQLCKVADFSVFSDFVCGDDDLNEFIRIDAEKHKKELLAETYGFQLLDETGGAYPPVAFVSLSNDSIQLDDETKINTFPNLIYPTYPAVLIARLAVHSDYQKQNIGSNLINMLKALFVNDNRTGCRFLTVDAYKAKRVMRFYNRNDFIKLKEGRKTYRMYFDLIRFQ